MEQRVVIVTGGAQGIGRAISQSFAQTGAVVVMADADQEAGEEALAAFDEQRQQARFFPTDVSDETQIRTLVDRVGREFGRIDVVINNAGTSSNMPIEELPVHAWDKVLGVNLRGPFMLAKYAVPYLRKAAPGIILNIASTRAFMSEANTEAYSASKGGLVALTHALAISLGPDIRVNAISPGWIEVGDWKKRTARTEPQHSPADLAQHPVGRVGTPDDIGNTCVFLASKEAGFITGQNIVIDGGMTVKMIYEP